jgi:methionyl-tRNA formyltransferase
MACFGEAFHLVVKDHFTGSPQVGTPTYFPRKVPFNGVIDPSWSRGQVDRFIRALYFPPFKGAVVRLQDGEEREVSSIDDYDRLVADYRVGIGEKKL